YFQAVTVKIVATRLSVAPVISRLLHTAPLTSSATGYSMHNLQTYPSTITFDEVGNFCFKACILPSLAQRASLPIKAYKQTILAQVISPCKNNSSATPVKAS
ncbi:GSCOCG00007723001-RA-CDS, partial [Cotesia congregata]